MIMDLEVQLTQAKDEMKVKVEHLEGARDWVCSCEAQLSATKVDLETAQATRNKFHDEVWLAEEVRTVAKVRCSSI